MLITDIELIELIRSYREKYNYSFEDALRMILVDLKALKARTEKLMKGKK